VSAIDFTSPDHVDVRAEEMRRNVTVEVLLTSPTPGRIGRVLDDLTSLLEEITQVLCTGGIETQIRVPGYHKTFYGYEADQDDG
jgi:hypothetical protein